MREQVRELVDKQVKDTLGSEFGVLDMQIRQGSALILFVIGTLGTVYMGFSRYESFVKNANLLGSQVCGFLRRYFRRNSRFRESEVTATGAWRPGPAMITAEQLLRVSSGIDSCKVILGYLIFSHACLLAVLIWIVVKHLK
jgi:hypothetical protein